MNTIAAIQMNSSHRVDENLLAAAELIAEAAQNGAQLAVLPEMFAIMGAAPQEKLQAIETYQSGKIQSFLSAQAKINNIWLVGGTVPIATANHEKARAACLVFNNKGELVSRYDKIHLFDVTVSESEIHQESQYTEPGSELVIVNTSVGRLGLAVCYDVRFPELFRYLFNKGAEILALPSAFTETTGTAHWEVLIRARAIENLSYVIAAGQTGIHANGRRTYGNTMIIDPWGKILARVQNDKPGIAYADIDLDYLRKIRKSMPVANHQKIFFDVSGL